MTERAGYKYTPKDLLIRRIKERLDKCDGKHKCHPSTQPRLPTRVIEVGMEGEMPALRITHPSETGLYVALSYCWGGPQEMATTLSSLQSMAKGFDMDSLPKTIQDAVRLTRCLGFRYLWIDAFCIIQDSEDDKMHEINKMGTIYKNTVLTIAAASAQGVHDGFLHEVSALHHCVVPFKLTNGCTGIVHFSSSSSDPLHDPLNSRAWTLQEVMMSARNLYFGRSGMQWACLSEYRNLITGEILSKPPYPSLPLNTIPVLAKIPGTGPLEYWWGTLVKHYTQRALSFSEDRLPALSGIAGHFLRAFSFNDTYLAGIWQAFWFVHLEWYDSWHDSNLQAKTPSTARSEGPSWSWASFGGPVTFDFRAFSSPDAELLSALMFLVSSDAPLGRVHGGNLVIRARLAKLTRAEFLWLSSHPHPKKSEFRMDYGRDEPDGQERLRYMLLAYDFERSGMGLILQPQGNGIYVRVGQVFLRALYLDSVWPVTMERQTITII